MHYNVEMVYLIISGLGFAEGQTTWKVFDSEMTEHKSYQDIPDRFKAQLHPGLFWKVRMISFLSLNQKIITFIYSNWSLRKNKSNLIRRS